MQPKSTRITLTCPVCGTTFQRNPYYVKTVAKPTCGRICANVIRFGSLEERFLAKVDKRSIDECWEWKSNKNPAGYGIIRDRKRRRSAHRVAYEVFTGPIPEGMHVLHRCDNTSCVNPHHLFLGTHAENMNDMHSKGRAKAVAHSGESNGWSKLTQDQVVEIRELHSSGIPSSEIASRFGITREHVWSVVARRSWKHVP